VQRLPAAGQPAQRLVQRGQIAADAAHVPHFAFAPGFGQRDVDRCPCARPVRRTRC
jgi:hypothetical protein